MRETVLEQVDKCKQLWAIYSSDTDGEKLGFFEHTKIGDKETWIEKKNR